MTGARIPKENQTVVIKTRTLIFRQRKHLLTWMKQPATRVTVTNERAQMWPLESSATLRSEEPMVHCHCETTVGAESGDGEHMGRTNPIPPGTLRVMWQSLECEGSIRLSREEQLNISLLSNVCTETKIPVTLEQVLQEDIPVCPLTSLPPLGVVVTIAEAGGPYASLRHQ